MRNNAIASIATTPDTREASSARTTATWWQWMLLYPSLVATLITAVPTWIDRIQAANIGVKASDLAQAKEQKRLWETNLDCTRAQEIQRIRTSHNTEVGAQVCPSGDVLVQLKRPSADQTIYRWVSARTLEQEASLLFHPAAAYASPGETVVAQVPQSVVNQRWLQPGLLKQRVRQGGGCLDLVINTYTGSVHSQMPVACNAPF
jgi:hypothetical protein